MESNLKNITAEEISKIAEELELDFGKVFNAVVSVIADNY